MPIITEGGPDNTPQVDPEYAEQELAFRPSRRQQLKEDLQQIADLLKQLREINESMESVSYQLGEDPPPKLASEHDAIMRMLFEADSAQQQVLDFVDADEQAHPVLKEQNRAEVLKHLNDLGRMMEDYEKEHQESGELEAVRKRVASIELSLDREPWWK